MLTNDNFTAAIEASHRVNSEIYSLDFEKRNRSEQLQKEVDAWLANKANKIDDLPMGFTQFKDGNLPAAKISKTANQKRIDESNIKITRENNRISEIKRKKEDAQKIKREALEKVERDKIAVLKQYVVLQPFYDKAKSQDITKLCRMVDVTSVQLRKALDKKALPDGKLELIEKALIDFEWFVPKARMSGKHNSNKSRKKLSQEDVERKRRWHIINNARKEAVEKRLKRFTAICAYHGETLYMISSTGGGKCIACKQEHSKNYAKRRKEKRLNIRIEAGAA